MPRSTLEALALRWVPGDGPVEVQALTSGLVNESCRVARAGRLYSMRVATAGGGDLGVDREWECKVLGRAAAAGLAPAILCCEPAQGILVADWVNGRTWAPREIGQPAQIRAMAQLLRRVHALAIPLPARVMSPAAWIAHYSEASEASAHHGSAVPRPSAGLRGAAEDRLWMLAASRSHEPALCHSDLHSLNVSMGERLMLLDWEYAHVSDPYWDLAGWTANNDWTEPLAAQLLANYLERPAEAHESAHLALLVWLYDYVCLLWSELYLRQRPGAASDGVSDRAAQLAIRLSGASGSRAG